MDNKDYKFQVSDNYKGMIWLARGDDAKQCADDFKEFTLELGVDMRKAVDTASVAQSIDKTEDSPFYSKDDTCPSCGKGKLVRKQGTGKTGKPYDFLGCDNYPNCRYINND